MIHNSNANRRRRNSLLQLRRAKGSSPFLRRDFNPIPTQIRVIRRKSGRRGIIDCLTAKFFHNHFQLRSKRERRAMIKKVIRNTTKSTHFVKPLISNGDKEGTIRGRNR